MAKLINLAAGAVRDYELDTCELPEELRELCRVSAHFNAFDEGHTLDGYCEHCDGAPWGYSCDSWWNAERCYWCGELSEELYDCNGCVGGMKFCNSCLVLHVYPLN